MSLTKCGDCNLIPLDEIAYMYQSSDSGNCFIRLNNEHSLIVSKEVGKIIADKYESKYSSPIVKTENLINRLQTKLNNYLNSIRANPT